MVVIHGAGSFGHQIAHRTGLHLGLREEQHLFAMGETQRLQYELDACIAKIFLEEGLPVMPCQASASAVMEAGTLVSMTLDALKLLVHQGMVPLLYGVPAVDRRQGCSILSGDQIAPCVALGLSMTTVIHGTDVDGVFDEDPRVSPQAQLIPTIDQDNWETVQGQLSGSANVDVTGGMAGKVASLVTSAQQGLETRIVDATQPGRLAAALAGEAVGTLVKWSAS
jgi:isopentenyl phosphate kinase